MMTLRFKVASKSGYEFAESVVEIFVGEKYKSYERQYVNHD